MSGIDLDEAVLDAIRTVFRRHANIQEVVLFGSRAKGTARPNSDIDLAVRGTDDDLAVESLAMELEELPLPYQFDVHAMDSIRYQPLLDHIKRVGVSVYTA